MSNKYHLLTYLLNNNGNGPRCPPTLVPRNGTLELGGFTIPVDFVSKRYAFPGIETLNLVL